MTPKKVFRNDVMLIAAICLGILSGCADDQYSIERQYWKAQRQAGKIIKNPHASPPREVEYTVGLQNNFIRKYPDSILSVQAGFNIVRLYLAKQEYEKARVQAKALINKYSANESFSSDAAYLLGYSYELENKWNSALTEYRKIMQAYPRTVKGLGMPIYIARHYKEKYQPDKMLSAYREAAAYYEGLAQKYPKTPFGYTLSILAARCHIAMKDWNSAVASFNSIVEAYKDKAKMDSILLNIALIYSKQLNDNVSAKATLERLIKEYPDSKFIKIADKLLKGIKEAK